MGQGRDRGARKQVGTPWPQKPEGSYSHPTLYLPPASGFEGSFCLCPCLSQVSPARRALLLALKAPSCALVERKG